MIIIVFLSLSFNVKGQGEDKLQEAIEMYNDGLYKNAIIELQKILKSDEKNVNAWLYLSYSGLAAEDFKLAKDGFMKVQMYTNNDEIKSASLLGLGSIKLETGDFNNAIADFSKAILLNDKNSEIFIFRGDAYLELDDYNNALKDYNSAIAKNPSNGLAYFSKGQLLCDIGEYAQATENFLKANSIEPSLPDYHHWQGICYFYLDKFEESIIHIDAAIIDEYAFDLWELYYYRGASNYYLLKFDEAIYDFKLSLKERKDPFTYYKLGLAYSKILDFSLAKESFEKAINISPDNPEYFNSLAFVSIQLNEFTYARKMITEAKKISTDNYYTSMVDALVSLSEKKYSEAIEKLDESIQFMNNKKLKDPDPYLYLGKAYYELNNIGEACKNLKKYFKLGGLDKEAKSLLEKKCSM